MKLNAAQLAAIAAGASQELVASLAAVADVVELSADELAAAASAAEAETIRLAAEAAAVLAASALAATTEAARLAALVEAPNALVAHLQTQLTAANAEVLAAKLEASTYKAAADAQTGLMSIAKEALSNKLVALGGSAVAAETFTAGNIAAEYDRVNTLFKASFKIGQQSVNTPVTPAKPTAIDPMMVEIFKHVIPA